MDNEMFKSNVNRLLEGIDLLGFIDEKNLSANDAKKLIEKHMPKPEPQPNPWENGTIYQLAREWVLENPDRKAVAITQTEDGHVFVEFLTLGELSWFSTEKEIGNFPEHPNGWQNSYTPLPPIPPLERWGNNTHYYVTTDGEVILSKGITYPSGHLLQGSVYSTRFVNIWHFTRDELTK